MDFSLRHILKKDEIIMDNKTLKKILQDCTTRVGFSYCNKNYYYSDNNIIIVINVQKSNYAGSVYVNYGFCVRDIHVDLKYPKINECDIVGRFINNIDDMEKTDFLLDELESDKLEKCFETNIERTIIPVINEGIKKYFEIYPKSIMTAKQKIKEYLEI